MRRTAIGALSLLIACGCSGESDTSTSPSTPTGSSPAADPNTPTVVLNVPGMTWPVGWKPRVQKALASLPGVASVDVDSSAKTASCRLSDPSKFDSQKAVEALASAGFKGSTVAE